MCVNFIYLFIPTPERLHRPPARLITTVVLLSFLLISAKALMGSASQNALAGLHNDMQEEQHLAYIVRRRTS